MKITAVKDDNLVIVDGMARRVVFSSVMPADWHAVQWSGSGGHIEFSADSKRNEVLTDASIANLLKAAWDAGVALGSEVATAPDTVAAARAEILDDLIIAAAANPVASQRVKDAAVEIAQARGGRGG